MHFIKIFLLGRVLGPALSSARSGRPVPRDHFWRRLRGRLAETASRPRRWAGNPTLAGGVGIATARRVTWPESRQRGLGLGRPPDRRVVVRARPAPFAPLTPPRALRPLERERLRCGGREGERAACEEEEEKTPIHFTLPKDLNKEELKGVQKLHGQLKVWNEEMNITGISEKTPQLIEEIKGTKLEVLIPFFLKIYKLAEGFDIEELKKLLAYGVQETSFEE